MMAKCTGWVIAKGLARGGTILTVARGNPKRGGGKVVWGDSRRRYFGGWEGVGNAPFRVPADARI